MTAQEFNVRYPRRLLKLADRSQCQVISGMQHLQQPSRTTLRLIAYFETDDLIGYKLAAKRVILDPHQTHLSFMRILLSMFQPWDVERVYNVWTSQLHEDFTLWHGSVAGLDERAKHSLVSAHV